LFVGVIGLNLKTSYWLTATQGINRVREVQASNLWGGLVYLIIGSVLLLAGLKLVALAIAVGSRALVARWICMRAFSSAARFDRSNSSRPDRTMLRRLWPNAKKFGIMSIGSYCITQGLILIGSQMLSLNVLASLGLTQQIGIFVVSIASLWLQVKWPEITILRTQGRSRTMSVLFARRLALSIASLASIGAVVILFGNQLLQWKGTQTRLLPVGPLSYYLAYLTFQMTYGAFGMLAMTENVIPFYRIAIGTGIATVLLSIAMTFQWHLWGLLLAPLICEAAYSAWFTIRYGFKTQPLTVLELLRAAAFVPV
jgi:O-antigen/teichoic acid export membrane protein